MESKCAICNQVGTTGYPNKWREDLAKFICSRCYGRLFKNKETIRTYDLCVRFTTDRELTEDEKGTLQHQVIAQIEEPVTADGDDVTYSTAEIFISDIDKVKENKK
jgi:hypothetical protein